MRRAAAAAAAALFLALGTADSAPREDAVSGGYVGGAAGANLRDGTRPR
jgi:hypothetical protein